MTAMNYVVPSHYCFLPPVPWPQDIEMIAGNDWPPGLWQFCVTDCPLVLFDLRGSEFYLSVNWPGGSLARNSVDHPTEIVLDNENSIVAWNYTVAQSRLLPLGRIATYELERRAPAEGRYVQQTLIGGHVNVTGGINVD